MLEFSRGVERVDIHRHQAGTEQADQHDGILQQVGQHDRNTFSSHEPERFLQVAGKAHRQAVDIPVAKRRSEIRESRAIRVFRERELGHLAE